MPHKFRLIIASHRTPATNERKRKQPLCVCVCVSMCTDRSKNNYQNNLCDESIIIHQIQYLSMLALHHPTIKPFHRRMLSFVISPRPHKRHLYGTIGERVATRHALLAFFLFFYWYLNSLGAHHTEFCAEYVFFFFGRLFCFSPECRFVVLFPSCSGYLCDFIAIENE